MIRVSLGLGLGRPASGPPPAPAENLLTWTEAFDNAAWTKSSASVSANAGTDPDGGSTADRITNASTSGAVRQVTATAASGAGTFGVISALGAWDRYSLTHTFDGQPYTFSVYVKDGSGGGVPGLRLRMDVSGGFLRCSIEDAGDEGIYDAWGAQLETGSSPTAYQPRTT